MSLNLHRRHLDTVYPFSNLPPRNASGLWRYRIPKAPEVPCPKRGGDPAGFVVSLNLHRRHLDTSQRAMVAAKLATLPNGVKQASSIGEASKTQAEAAGMLKVSERTVRSARDKTAAFTGVAARTLDKADALVASCHTRAIFRQLA